MKNYIAITVLSALVVGCMPAETATSDVQATYEANCLTVTKALENFQNEAADYSTHNQESFLGSDLPYIILEILSRLMT